MEKDYKSYSLGIGTVGLAIIRGTEIDFEVMTKQAEKFTADCLGFLQDGKLAALSVGCYAKTIRRFIIFA